jgi:putative membrane protein
MWFDMRILVVANFVFQLLLMIIVFAAAYLARRKRFGKHCLLMRIALPLQVITIVIIMLPSMLGYLRYPAPGSLLNFEILVHHSLGVAVIGLWIYINLTLAGILRLWGRTVVAMRLAFILWVVTFLLGLHLYILIWV